jgi:iron complex outermembrane receptor protein
MSIVTAVTTLVLVALTVTPLPAAAEQADVVAPVMIITARDLREMQDLPANATKLDAAALRRGGFRTVIDALEDQGGIYVRSITGSPVGSELGMRGFGENSHGRVLVLVDGHPINRPDLAGPNFLQIPIGRVEQVEIVRGSQTALYGDKAVGGVINIITKKGADTPFALDLSADGGSYGQNSQRLTLSGTTDGLRYAFHANRYATDGYRDRTSFESWGLGGNLGYALTDWLETALDVSMQVVDYELPGRLTLDELYRNRRRAQNPDDEGLDRYFDTGLGLTASLGNGQELDLRVDYGRKDIQSDMVSWGSFSDLVIDTHGATPRYTLSSTIGGHANRLIAGVDLALNQLDVDRYATPARTDTPTTGEVDMQTVGGYVRNEFAVLDDLVLGLGARVERAETDARVSTAGAETVDDSKTHDVTAFEVSLNKTFENKSKLFARVGSVYRFPFVDEQVSYYGFGDTFYTDIEAEEGLNMELGADVVVADGLTVGATLYRLDMEDEIAFNGVTFRNENLDETSHRGVEANASYTPADTYRLSVNYTYTDASFTDGPNDGNEIPLVPQHKASLALEADLPLDIDLRTVVTYVGKSWLGGDYANTGDKIDDYTVVDLFARRDCPVVDGLSVYVGVENLFNEKYVTAAYQGFDANAYYPAPEATLWGGASYTF